MNRPVLWLLITLTAYASALPLEEDGSIFPIELGADRYPRFIEFSDDEEELHTVDLEEQIDAELLAEITRNPSNNRYYLFTRRNPNTAQELSMNNANSIHNSNFDASHETIVIAHGWLSNQKTNLNPVIRDAYLGRGDTNVIIIDWRRLAISNYVTAANGVPAVGRGLGQFLAFLSSLTGARFEDMHLIGFSLGAHLVGNAGRELGGRVGRVTGLDPAGPLFNYLSSNGIRKTDGIYVEGIHTHGNTVHGLGIGSPIGDSDFFPNGGKSQPGCVTPICDHNRAWELFAATVSYNHLLGTQCSGSLQISLNSCRGSNYHMGNAYMNKNGSGMYRLNTGRRYPF